jgi:SSS family solute:Na+ symporter
MTIELRPLDAIALTTSLVGMLAVGLYFSRRNTSTEEYFVGSRSFPGWAIGLSMLGTSISSVTFLAFPAAAYKLDWRQFVSNLMLPAVAVLAIVMFIPFFRRGQLTSAFEYLGHRFGPVARLYGTVSFIVLQLIRLATVLLLMSIPVSLLSGLRIEYVIVIAGIFIAFYTIAGGIEAVIWTDVVQAIVLWAGGAVCLGYIVWHLPGGFSEVIAIGQAHDKFHVGAMEWNIGERTFWTVALLGIFHYLAMYSSDQNFVQRYVATKSLREARKATALYSLLAVPTWGFFFLVGTCVFAFYQTFPDPAVAKLEADQVFPYFILTQIPAGIAGVVIAGVLAAAMSSLDSSLNAIATIVTVDLMKPYLAPGRSDRFYLRTAHVIATVAAVLMILGAIGFQHVEKESMNDLTWIMASVFGGCLVGIFLVGFFTTRVDNRAVLVALVSSLGFNVYLGAVSAGWLSEPESFHIHDYWIGMLVNLLFVVLAYGSSFLFGPPNQDLRGLTVWTMEKDGDSPAA